MIRAVFIQRKILELYTKLDKISFPVDPKRLLEFLPVKSAISTYQRVAKISGESVDDIGILCGSASGATFYDESRERYLILYNDTSNNGRSLWTQCHEIGHICLNHFSVINSSSIADNGVDESYGELEKEADYFAWNLIAPLPIMRELGISSISEIKDTFGMSSQAAALHYDRYVKWCRNHIKTSWENNMLREFRKKRV